MANEANGYIDLADRMTIEETATLIGVDPNTLKYWRCIGRHNLPFTKVGRKIYYSRPDVIAFLQARTGTSNAQIRAALATA